jgi:hypothetical protein
MLKENNWSLLCPDAEGDQWTEVCTFMHEEPRLVLRSIHNPDNVRISFCNEQFIDVIRFALEHNFIDVEDLGKLK